MLSKFINNTGKGTLFFFQFQQKISTCNMSLVPAEILSHIQAVYPPAKLKDGFILLPKIQTALHLLPLLAAPTKHNPTPSTPPYLDSWAIRWIGEDQWVFNQHLVRTRLYSLLGQTARIYARKTIAKRISQELSEPFLQQNHLLGSTKAKFKYGLFHEGKLVAVASFSGGRKVMRGDRELRSYELIRVCSLAKYTVIGGVSKLLKAFVVDQQPEDIMTYVSKDWSDGMQFQQFGFEHLEDTTPVWLTVDLVNGKRNQYRSAHPPVESGHKFIWHPGNAKYVWVL